MNMKSVKKVLHSYAEKVGWVDEYSFVFLIIIEENDAKDLYTKLSFSPPYY